jgi:starch synthase
MAGGKAVVASCSGQISEVLDNDRTGVLVKAGDIRELSFALVSLLKDPSRRKTIGENARKKALADHSWDRYVARLEAVYSSVLGDSRSGRLKTTVTSVTSPT